jgi:hypothetical protein
MFAVMVCTATVTAWAGSGAAGSSILGGSGTGISGAGLSPTCPGMGPPVSTNSPEVGVDPAAPPSRAVVIGTGDGRWIGILLKSKTAPGANRLSALANLACCGRDRAKSEGARVLA